MQSATNLAFLRLPCGLVEMGYRGSNKIYHRLVPIAVGLLLCFSANADYIFVADYGNNTVLKFDSSGARSVFASSGLVGPMGLALDTAGNLYVGNIENDTITKFNSLGQGTIFAQTGLNRPSGMAF